MDMHGRDTHTHGHARIGTGIYTDTARTGTDNTDMYGHARTVTFAETILFGQPIFFLLRYILYTNMMFYMVLKTQ